MCVNFTYQNLGEVVGRTTVGIGSLNNTNLDRINTSLLNKFSNEKGSKARDFITIQKPKSTIFGNIVKDDTISITIVRTTSITSLNADTRRSTLLSLDIISTTLFPNTSVKSTLH